MSDSITIEHQLPDRAPVQRHIDRFYRDWFMYRDAENQCQKLILARLDETSVFARPTKREIREAEEAIPALQGAAIKSLERVEKIPDRHLSKLPSDERLKLRMTLLQIRKEVRVQEENRADRAAEPAEKSKTSAYQDGYRTGYEDGQNQKTKRPRPGMFRSVVSDRYRQEFSRGYHQGHADALRKIRQAELKALSTPTIQRALKREGPER